MKLALAKPTFNTDPDEDLAPVDVYKQTSTEVVNSYQETSEQSQGLFDSLANINPQELLSQATQALGTASKVAAALARGQNMRDPFSGLAGGAGAIGAGGIAQSLKTLSAGLGLIRGVSNATNISQILGASARFAGRDGAAISKLAYSVGTVERNLSSFKSLQGRSGLSVLSRQLALGAGMGSAVGSILGDMSPAMTQSYNAAANAALSITGVVQKGTVVSGRTRDPYNATVINNAISEFRGDGYNTRVTDSAGLAGSIAGLTYASRITGIPGVFKTLTDDIDDAQVCKAAAVPLAREAATVGDVHLFMDLANSKVGNQLQSAVPELASGMISTVRPPEDLAQQEYGRLYDDFSSALNTVSPNWKTYKTQTGSSYVNAAYVAQNPFMQDMIAAKMNNMMGPPGSNEQSIYPQNSVYSSTPGLIDPDTAVVNTTTVEQFVATVDGQETVMTTQTTQVADEAFMMLASVFPGESVDAGLKEHFPYFHTSLGRPVMGIPI